MIAAVVGVVIATSGNDDTSASGSTTTTEEGTSTERSTTTGSSDTSTETSGGGTDTGTDVQTIAEQQVLSAGPSTVSCIASELDAAPDILNQLDGVEFATFDDPTQAEQYANIIVDCASVDELTTEFENALSQSGADQASIDCVVANMATFGTTQWVELISTSVQPSQSSYFTQVIQGLAIC